MDFPLDCNVVVSVAAVGYLVVGVEYLPVAVPFVWGVLQVVVLAGQLVVPEVEQLVVLVVEQLVVVELLLGVVGCLVLAYDLCFSTVFSGFEFDGRGRLVGTYLAELPRPE